MTTPLQARIAAWLAALLMAPLCVPEAAEVHVAPDGSDAGPGTKAQPLKTIQAAVNRLQPGDTCLVRGGVYRESVSFPRSGSPDRPIRLRACEHEAVTVSGCEPVTGWTPCSNGIWKAPMPWTLGTGRNQVFCDGKAMIEARHPNVPAPGLEMPVDGLSPLWPTYGAFSIPQETRVSRPGRIVSRLLEGQPRDYWKGALYCGVHFEGWCVQTGVIEGSEPGEIEVGDRTGGWWFGPAYDAKYPQDQEAGRGMIVGHVHALDAPGEWHWQDQTLYLVAPGGAEPRAVEAKRRHLAFELSGREHIRIEGVAVRAASMRLADAAHCVVDGCDLAHISHYTRQYGIGRIEKGRDAIRTGETGIFVGGHDNAFLNCSVRYSAGAGFHVRGHHHTIHNCLIDEVGYAGHYLNAVTDAVEDFGDTEGLLCGGHVVTFNTMRNAGRHFFNLHGNGTSLASRDRGPMDYAATLFAHNHLYNGMLLTRDAGFVTGYFCSGGTLNGLHSQVAWNVMHDSYDLSAIRWNKLGMVYLDQGTCRVDVHHNQFWAAPGALQRDLWFNTCCVDIREHDNVFHGLFARTSADLRPADFPGGRPFRFGHDFAEPPALPKWPPVVRRSFEAGQCVSNSPGVAKTASGLEGLGHGAWFAFDAPDPGAGWSSAVLRFTGGARAMNRVPTSRAVPRHRHVTDPLVLEAKQSDGTGGNLRMQWTFFHDLEDGAWLRFERVPLSAGYRRIRAVYGNDGAVPGRLEVRLDRADGPQAGALDLPPTDRARAGHVQIYREAVGALSAEATGTRDVFLVFRWGGAKPAVDFEYLRLEQARGDLPLQTNEVKVEVRADRPDGPRLGEFHPRCPRFSDGVREAVAALDPASAAGRIFLVVRSSLPEPLGCVHGIRLEKAVDPAEDPGIGVPPRRAGGASGRWIFPEPTHRPRPAPAGLPREPRASRPFHRAARLAAQPVVDGSPAEWTGPALELRQTPDGAASDEAPARAWVGFDAQALYVAMSCPRRAPVLPGGDGHRWGAADGVEIAFQNADTTPPGPILTLRGRPDGHADAPDVAGVPEDLRRRLADAVTYRAAVGAADWTCEWRIPFEVCGGAPALLNANLTVRTAGPDLGRTWSTAGGATYDLHNGGTLILAVRDTMLPAVLKESLAVWLDAADDPSVGRDDTGAVGVWRDRSGRGRDAVQNAAGFRPLYAAQGLNGKPALQFDDAKKMRMEVPDLSDRPITAAVFAVIGNPEPGLPQNSHARVFTASDGRQHDYLGGICCSVPGTETGGPRLIVFDGTDRWARRARVGCFSPHDQTFFKGSIAEILVFDRALTPDERFRVTAYLTGKWELGTP